MEYGNIYTNTNWGSTNHPNGWGSAYPQLPEEND
jgi:hypothetical protein